MADTYTYTPNSKLIIPAQADRNWNVQMAADLTMIDGFTPIGNLCVSLHETPSASLAVMVAPGKFTSAAGAIIAYPGNTNVVLAASAINFLFLSDAGSLNVNQIGFPSTVNYVPLAVAATGTSTVQMIQDQRFAAFSAGRPGASLPATPITTTPTVLSGSAPYLRMNVGSAAVITLPLASTLDPGTIITIKDVSGSAGVNNITLNRTGGDTIDGTTIKVINTNYGGLRLWCDGISKYDVLP